MAKPLSYKGVNLSILKELISFLSNIPNSNSSFYSFFSRNIYSGGGYSIISSDSCWLSYLNEILNPSLTYYILEFLFYYYKSSFS